MSNSSGRVIKPVVAIPHERVIHELAFRAFMSIAQRGVPFLWLPYGRTDFVRNKFAMQILDSEFTHVLMLDSDHIHPDDIVERLVRWPLQKPDIQVIGGLNFRRGEPFDPCVRLMDDDGEYYTPADWQEGTIAPVAAIGTGSILIAREVFEAGPPPWFYYDYSLVAGQDKWPTDDMGFAAYCRQHGIQQWCDTSTVSPHISDSVIDEGVYRQYILTHPGVVSEVEEEPVR